MLVRGLCAAGAKTFEFGIAERDQGRSVQPTRKKLFQVQKSPWLDDHTREMRACDKRTKVEDMSGGAASEWSWERSTAFRIAQMERGSA